jgi:hypothetical protein
MRLGGYPRFTVKKQMYINDCDGPAFPLRALAASAGIQFGDLQAEAYRLRDKLGPDRKKGYDESIRGLARGGAVSETERRALFELGARGFAVGSDAELRSFSVTRRPCISDVARSQGESGPAGNRRRHWQLRCSIAHKTGASRQDPGESVTTSGP